MSAGAATSAVLDASAVLAWLRDEPGAELVHPLLPAATISAANWSETHQKLLQYGVDAGRVTNRLRTLGVQIEPLTEHDAIAAANLWVATRSAGLSLGDRCCLALAARLDCVAITADTAWAGLDIDIKVRIIRPAADPSHRERGGA